MIALLLLVALSASAAEARLTADLDGQGAEQTAIAALDGRTVRLEIRDSRGKLLAKAAAPAPGGPAAVAVTSGTLGSAGALLEVVAAASESECRSLWRYREGNLTRTPVEIESGPLPDCAKPEWTYRWERPAPDAPALYVRERSVERAHGKLRQVEAFRYAGFRLAVDRERSPAWINGVEIPRWRSATLYPPSVLDNLDLRVDVQKLRENPRLRIVANRDEGIFEVTVGDPSRRETLPVTADSTAGSPRVRVLTLGAGKAKVQVVIAAATAMPVEATLEGAGAPLDRKYVAVERTNASHVVVFESAEEELARRYLPGLWDTGREQVAVSAAASAPAAVRFGSAEFTLSIADAPAGVDVLLVPRDGTLPSSGIQLRGQNSFLEAVLHCKGPAPAGPFACEPPAPGRTFRRAGARINEG